MLAFYIPVTSRIAQTVNLGIYLEAPDMKEVQNVLDRDYSMYTVGTCTQVKNREAAARIHARYGITEPLQFVSVAAPVKVEPTAMYTPPSRRTKVETAAPTPSVVEVSNGDGPRI